MKKMTGKLLCLCLCLALLCGFTGCAGEKALLSPDNPTMITVWTYYNGAQQESFDSLVSQFNNSVGAEKGIIVNSMSQGSIAGVADEVLNSAKDNVGAQELPQLAMVYPETAYELDRLEMLVNLDEYFTEEELSEYVGGFLEEGRLTKEGPLVIFPVAKSTEVFMYNKTDWDKFAADSGIYPEDLKSLEDLTAAAEEYYEWSDSLTPDIPEDGKALFGRDAVDNYMYVGMVQLGHDMFTVTDSGVKTDLDKTALRTLWDNYYVPFVKGYFAAEGKFRSDDAKTGIIISLVGSTSSSGYFPEKVTLSDDSSYEIEAGVLPAPRFRDAVDEYSVQQGAGLCELKSTPEKQLAVAEFLKWFTDDAQNIDFSINSGYLPVKISANDQEKLESAFAGKEARRLDVDNILVGAGIMAKDKLYTSKPFEGQADLRNIMKVSMSDLAAADRQEVKDRIAAGASLEEAVSGFDGDERFEFWYASLEQAIHEVVPAN